MWCKWTITEINKHNPVIIRADNYISSKWIDKHPNHYGIMGNNSTHNAKAKRVGLCMSLAAATSHAAVTDSECRLKARLA